jgi:hypothetical protein
MPDVAGKLVKHYHQKLNWAKFIYFPTCFSNNQKLKIGFEEF